MRRCDRVVIFLLLFFAVETAFAQIRPRFVSVLSFPNDARSVSMGGDALAAHEGPSHVFQKPKLDTALKIFVSLHSRAPNWNISDPFMVIGSGIFVNVNEYFAAGATLSNYSMGTDIAYGDSTATFKGNVQEYQLYATLFGRINLTENFAAALTVKRYKAGNDPVSTFFPGINYSGEGRGLGKAFFFDMSLSREIPLYFESYDKYSSVFIHAGVTNFGTLIDYGNGLQFEVPRSLHIGLVYNRLSLGEGVSSTEILFTHRTVLNAPDDENRNFMRIGAEIGISNTFFFRSGSQIHPYSTIFGDKNMPLWTFGFGIQAFGPAATIFEGYAFRFDISAIKIDQLNFPYLNILDRSYNYALSFTVIKL
ncbi:MAG: PorV/PorQ family protein [Bacteroidota bacterium]